MQHDAHMDGDAAQELKDILAYLEKQKEQKPAEWSEEDEQHREWILECLASGERKVPEYADQYRSAFNWLKSLRPQPHWKPSKEQIAALEYALGNGGTYNKEALKSLYEQLKKLYL